MSAKNHTPGPWEMSPSKFSDGSREVWSEKVWSEKEREERICRIMDGSETDANANLIAAAPDMLAALERFAEYCRQNSVPELQGIACDAFEAIRKARAQ